MSQEKMSEDEPPNSDDGEEDLSPRRCDQPPAPSRAPRPQHTLPDVRILHRFKLVLLGESGVGKTSLALRFVKDQFCEQFESTVGSAFFAPTIWVGEQEGAVKLEIWDTAGQERYRSLAPLYYRGACAAIIVYDITDKGTFSKVQGWVDELRGQRSANRKVLIALAGNKADLAEVERKVQWKEGQTYAAENDLLFIETSAKTSLNVTELFMRVATELVLNKQKAANRQERGVMGTMTLRETMEDPTRKRLLPGCCQ